MNNKYELNFCRVFEIPKRYPEGFLFAGGKDVIFKMIDWFNPIPAEHFFNDEVKEWDHYVPMIRNFVLKKDYVKDGCSYILITDFGESIVFKK